MKIIILSLCSSLPFTQTLAAQGQLSRNESIYTQPSKNSKVLKSLARGTKVELYERQGGWYKVNYQKYGGWMPLFSISEKESNQETALKRTAKDLQDAAIVLGKKSASVTVSSGIRGLNNEDLKNANNNDVQLHQLESFIVSPEAAQNFAKEIGLKKIGNQN